MQIQPTHLKSKSDSLQFMWCTYAATPGVESFVEFAVCLSSFSEFLKDKGLSGLHQTAHELEQRALSLFEVADRDALPPATMATLSTEVSTLINRVDLFVATNQRPVTPCQTTVTTEALTELWAASSIWFVGNVTPTSESLTRKRVAKSSCWNRHFSRASCPLQLRWTHAHSRNSNAAGGTLPRTLQ